MERINIRGYSNAISPSTIGLVFTFIYLFLVHVSWGLINFKKKKTFPKWTTLILKNSWTISSIDQIIFFLYKFIEVLWVKVRWWWWQYTTSFKFLFMSECVYNFGKCNHIYLINKLPAFLFISMASLLPHVYIYV